MFYNIFNAIKMAAGVCAFYWPISASFLKADKLHLTAFRHLVLCKKFVTSRDI